MEKITNTLILIILICFIRAFFASTVKSEEIRMVPCIGYGCVTIHH